MEGFEELLKSCESLQASLRRAEVGAVPFSFVNDNCATRDHWEKILLDELKDITMLNSKLAYLNSVILKDQITIDDELDINEAKTHLKNVTNAQGRCKNALKTMAMSRTVMSAFQENDEEKMSLFKDLLTKLFYLNSILEKLNCEEEKENKKMREQTEIWKQVKREWAKKQNEEINNLQEQAAVKPTNNAIAERMSKLLYKMEIMKLIQGKLLCTCLTYDLYNDPDDLEKYLKISREPPYKFNDFL